MYQLLLVSIRNFFVENFFVKINGLYSNNKFYTNNWLSTLFFIFNIIPFIVIKILFNLLKYQIIYEVDGIHTITNITTNHILPIILKFELVNINSKNSINITNTIKYYNSSLPLRYIIEKNNFTNYDEIKIKYINKGRITEKSLNIETVINNRLFNLFEN